MAINWVNHLMASQANLKSNFRIIVASATAHFGFALILFFIPVINDSGVRVYPLGEPAYLDYAYYLILPRDVWAGFSQPFDIPSYATWRSYPGPVLPILIELTNYRINRDLLALIFMFLGFALSSMWGLFLVKCGAPLFFQMLVVAFPLLLYYTHIVSTDLLFATITFAFFTMYCRTGNHHQHDLRWLVTLAVLASLTRPNGIVFLPLILIWCNYHLSNVNLRLFWAFIVVALSLYFSLYYLPYYLEHQVNSSNTHYWGFFPEQFWSGLFSDFPEALSKLLSISFLFFSKLLHAFGVRPSYAGLDDWLILARAIPGIFVLVGVVIWALKANLKERYFLLFFLLPVFLGASQERYTLGIVPFALFWFWQGTSFLFSNRQDR